MLLKPIDKTSEDSPKCRSIKPSDSSNQLLAETVPIQSTRNIGKNSLSCSSIRRDVQHLDGLSGHSLPSSVFRNLVHKRQPFRRHEGQPPLLYGLGIAFLVGASLPLTVCQHVGNLAHDTRRGLSDFVKTEEVVTVCRSSTLKGVVGSPPLADIAMPCLPPPLQTEPATLMAVVLPQKEGHHLQVHRVREVVL